MRPGTPPHGAWWGGVHGLLFHYFFYHFTAGKRGASEGGHYWSGKRGWSWDEITKTPFLMGAGTIVIITGGSGIIKNILQGIQKEYRGVVTITPIWSIFAVLGRSLRWDPFVTRVWPSPFLD